MCVAEISMRSARMPVARWACCLARSQISRGTMQLSTTTKATRSRPSSTTRARACNGSRTLSKSFSVKPPLQIAGKLRGLMFSTAAPTRSSPAFAQLDARPPIMAAATTTAIGRKPSGHIGRLGSLFMPGGTSWMAGSEFKPGSRNSVSSAECVDYRPRSLTTYLRH